MVDGWLNQPFSLKGKKVWIAGHRGMVGSSLLRRLDQEDCDILKADFDFRRQDDVEGWVSKNRPDVVIIAAAKVGGILANRDYPADFLYDNLMIEANIIHASAKFGAQKLVFLGSSCIYPKNAAQPIKEGALLSGCLEETNEAYAIAKIAGVKLCDAYRNQNGCDFISLMPCNLYGAGDSFDEKASHVIPALMMKIHDAKVCGRDVVEIWGSGKPLREFLHVDDAADGILFALGHYSSGMPLNIGSGAEVSIHDLAMLIADVIGFGGRLCFNVEYPDGVMRKIMDSSRIMGQGWVPKIALREGLEATYHWYQRQDELRAAA